MIWKPVFDDHGRRLPCDKWLIEAETYDKALDKASEYFLGAEPHIRPFLVPHQHAWDLIGVTLVVFTNGIAVI